MKAEAVAVMLREDRAEWKALVAGLAAHPEESLHDSVSPPWTSRDVYAHLARWIKRSTARLEARLAGRALPPLEGTDDEINARWQLEDSGLSLGEAREHAEAAFERRLRAIETVPADRWDEELERIARADGAEHYRGHRSYIVVA
jgi:hypothetical protein